jgi:hypothetical protein
MSDEGWICEYKIKGIVILLGDVFRMVEVVLKEIWIVFCEIGVELDGRGITSKRKMGFSWFGLSMA